MWIICLADDSHEMPSFIFSGKKYKKKKIKMLSAAIVTSALMVKESNGNYYSWKLLNESSQTIL